MTDANSSVIMSYVYDAYGNVVYEDGTLAQRYQFSTKEYNSSSGLIYFGARYYDPTFGRFITPDPSGIIDGPNLYIYCNNNPINYVDPWGLCKDKPWWQKWIEKIVATYGVYGGPGHTDPTFKTRPADSMDELFMQHDWLWTHGKWRQSNKILLMDLLNLPFNPNEWKRKPNNILWTILYREGAIELFYYWNLLSDTNQD